MKFFISHASKDKEIATAFSSFLGKLNVNVRVFCSSISGAIRQGEDFVETIEAGLEDSDVFIPLISKNYSESKYCLIELGYAYSKKVSHKKKHYILPFSIPPIMKSEALLGTPLSHLQTSALNDVNDLHNFLKILIDNQFISDYSILNNDIFEFVDKINSIIMNNGNILEKAEILPICSDDRNRDAINCNKIEEGHVVNFNLFANGENQRPSFISLVLKFPGTFSLYDFLQTNIDIKFYCIINNYTNSLTHIDIEFKYHEPHMFLKSYKKELQSGLNEISIPIRDMNTEGLKQISEICFVAWNSYIVEEEGMFTVEHIQVK